MKYLATIKYGTDSHSQSFDTIHDAKQWLDIKNTTQDHTTIIAEIDDKWNVTDWFYYHKGIEE